MKTLITYLGNWADEMDFNSHFILDEGGLDLLQRIQTYNKEDLKNTGTMYVGLGSNEDKEYDNAYDLYNDLNICQISDEEAKVIEKYFGVALGAASIYYVLEDILNELEKNEM